MKFRVELWKLSHPNTKDFGVPKMNIIQKIIQKFKNL